MGRTSDAGIDGGRKASELCGSPYSYTISKTSEYPEEALALVDFLVRPENNIEYCKMGGLIPIKNDVGDDETYGENGPYAPFLAQLNDPNFTVPPTYGAFNYTDLHQGYVPYRTAEVSVGTAVSGGCPEPYRG